MKKNWGVGAPAWRWSGFGFALLLLIFFTRSDNAVAFASRSALRSASKSAVLHRALAAKHVAPDSAEGEVAAGRRPADLNELASGLIAINEDLSAGPMRVPAENSPSADGLGLLLRADGVSQFQHGDDALAAPQAMNGGPFSSAMGGPYAGANGVGGFGMPFGGAYIGPAASTTASNLSAASSDPANGTIAGAASTSDPPLSTPEPSTALLLALGLAGLAFLCTQGRHFRVP